MNTCNESEEEPLNPIATLSAILYVFANVGNSPLLYQQKLSLLNRYPLQFPLQSPRTTASLQPPTSRVGFYWRYIRRTT
jgi:hypothetical protein